jgi:hypothetical protein
MLNCGKGFTQRMQRKQSQQRKSFGENVMPRYLQTKVRNLLKVPNLVLYSFKKLFKQ